MRIALPALVILAFGWAVLWAGQSDERESKKPLPEIVRTLLAKTFPEAEITEFHREKEDGDWIFEVNLAEANGKEYEVDITPEGLILKVVHKIPVEELPDRVRRAIHKLYPEGEVNSVEMTTRFETRYELDVRVGRKKREVRISSKGRILEIEKKHD